MVNHQYFSDPEDNNEVDALRAALNVMSEHNLWEFAQRALLFAAEAQAIMRDRFPETWITFDRNINEGASDEVKN